MTNPAQEGVAAGVPLQPEEKKNVLLHPSLTSALRPETPANLNAALSLKQNYAMAAEQLFVHALNRTVWQYRNHYDAVQIMIDEIRNTAMESMATQAGLAMVSNIVFRNASMREFLFTLQVQFFSQFSEFNDHWADMIGNIATSLSGSVIAPYVDPAKNLMPDSFETADEGRDLTPDELVMRRFSAEEMKSWLLSNNWLIMFIFVSLWGRTYTYDELRAINRRVQASN